TARVFDAATGRALVTLAGHAGSVVTASFSPDGRSIVTASTDHTGKIFDAESGRELLPLLGHAAYVTGVAFSPDGRRVLTSSIDGTVVLHPTSVAEHLAIGCAILGREEGFAAQRRGCPPSVTR